jgi:hypothetical protein
MVKRVFNLSLRAARSLRFHLWCVVRLVGRLIQLGGPDLQALGGYVASNPVVVQISLVMLFRWMPVQDRDVRCLARFD